MASGLRNQSYSRNEFPRQVANQVAGNQGTAAEIRGN